MQRPYIERREDRRVRGAGARAGLAALAPWQPLLADVVLVVHEVGPVGDGGETTPLAVCMWRWERTSGTLGKQGCIY